MLYVTQEEMNAWHSGRQKYLKLTFSDGTIIENEDISSESMTIEQSLCEGEQFEFGYVSASSFNIQVLGVTQRFKGLELDAEISVTTEDGTFTRPLGHYIVDSDVATSDRLYRNLVCYDVLYQVLPHDYSEWHNSQPFPMTLKEYRDSFFDYIQVEQETTVLVNDDMIIPKNFVAENYSGSDILKSICEINGVCGHINYNGKFRYVVMKVDFEGLYPRNDLYPMDPDPTTLEGLYPKDPETYTIRGSGYIQGSLVYEEFECQPITQLQIRMSEGDIGYITGSEGNTYIIQDNPLVYGMSSEDLATIAENVFSMIRILHYTPSSIKAPVSLWYELGDVINIIADNGSSLMCIFNRKMTGITALFDEYSCKGVEYYSEKANSTMKSIIVLKQKSNELLRSVEENRLTITEVRTDLNENVETLTSEIVQKSDAINLRVTQVVEEQEIVNGELQEGVNNSVRKGTVSSEISLEPGQIDITSNRISIDSDNFKVDYNGNMECTNAKISGNITATSGNLTNVKVTSLTMGSKTWTGNELNTQLNNISSVANTANKAARDAQSALNAVDNFMEAQEKTNAKLATWLKWLKGRVAATGVSMSGEPSTPW